MKSIKIIFLLSLLILAPITAQADLFNAKSFKLENGLEVVAIPNHRAPIVTQMIWYKVGAADDPQGKSGVTHFLEHLMFKGTTKFPHDSFSSTIKKLGGDDNAFTTHDYTAFYQNVPKEHLAKAMEMEADRMQNLLLSQSDVESERKVIIEERKQRTDNSPQAVFYEQMLNAIYMNHPYATPVIGWLAEMEGLTRDDALINYKKFYSPNNAVLVVAGDITADELKPLAEKYYGSIKPSGDTERRRVSIAPLSAERKLYTSNARIRQPELIKMFRAPRGDMALELASRILGGDTSSKLYTKLVLEEKSAIELNVSYDPISLSDTILTISAIPAPNVSLEQLDGKITSELGKQSLSESDLEKVKQKKLAEMSYYLDALQTPAMFFGERLVSGFDIKEIEGEEAAIKSITLDAAQKSLEKVFAKNNFAVTGFLMPETQKVKNK